MRLKRGRRTVSESDSLLHTFKARFRMKCQGSNNRLQRTVMHKVPRHIAQRAAAEPRRYARV